MRVDFLFVVRRFAVVVMMAALIALEVWVILLCHDVLYGLPR